MGPIEPRGVEGRAGASVYVNHNGADDPATDNVGDLEALEPMLHNYLLPGLEPSLFHKSRA